MKESLKKIFDPGEEGTKFYRKYTAVVQGVIVSMLVAIILGGVKLGGATISYYSNIRSEVVEIKKGLEKTNEKLNARDSVGLEKAKMVKESIDQLYQITALHTDQIKTIALQTNENTASIVAANHTLNIMSRKLYLEGN